MKFLYQTHTKYGNNESTLRNAGDVIMFNTYYMLLLMSFCTYYYANVKDSVTSWNDFSIILALLISLNLKGGVANKHNLTVALR